MDQIDMMKYLFLLLLMLPVSLAGQGHKGSVEECAPFKGGKVCYTDEVGMDGTPAADLYANINTWAKKTYGKDVFLSNVSSDEKKKTILVSSKVELLLGETDKTRLKYKMVITCSDGKYNAELSNITYQYDAGKDNRYKTYNAEDILTDNGKGNIIADIADPELFCNATFFFVQSLFADVLSAAAGD